MGSIVVAGITNLETSVEVESYPLEYAKSRFVFNGIRDRIGGVGFNVGNALAHLGAEVELATMLGRDPLGAFLRQRLGDIAGLGMRGTLNVQESTLRSTILVDRTGRGAMFTDLKDSQEIAYPPDAFAPLLQGAAIVHASNINWALALAHQARAAGVTVSTDVQAIARLDEPYNRRFLDVADIVFFSGENLQDPPERVIERMWAECDIRLAICTMAEKGALIGDRTTSKVVHQSAVPLRPVRNVTGAGDSFASGFLAAYARGYSPIESTLRGQLVAGYRIGEEGRGHGLPPLELLESEFEKRRGGRM